MSYLENKKIGQLPKARSTSVVLASDQPPVPVTLSGGSATGTPAVTSVTSAATNTPIVAANANRKGLYVFNGATTNLLLKLGATASASSFTVKIAPGGYYEMPTSPLYVGAVDGIWEGSPTGSANVTELS